MFLLSLVVPHYILSYHFFLLTFLFRIMTFFYNISTIRSTVHYHRRNCHFLFSSFLPLFKDINLAALACNMLYKNITLLYCYKMQILLFVML